MDVDGTLTDGKIYIGNDGEIFKAFDVKDGYGIHSIITQYGIIPVIITGRKSNIVKKRAAELRVSEIYQGISDKLECLQNVLKCHSKEQIYNLNNVAYIGDDLNDIALMHAVKNANGIVACPSNAVSEVIKVANYVCEKEGGNGAVREFIEWIVRE